MEKRIKIDFNLTEKQWQQVSTVLMLASSKLDEKGHEVSPTLDKMMYKIECTLRNDIGELHDWLKDLKAKGEDI